MNSSSSASDASSSSSDASSDVAYSLWQSIVVIVGTVTMLLLMALEVAPPDMVMWAFIVLLIPLGIITSDEAISGFSSSGLMIVAVLFIVVEGVSLTGGLELIKKLIVPGADRKHILPIESHLRIILPVMLLSSFVNNTPVVILCIPVVQELCRHSGVSPSRLMIPLSYSSIFGGTLTLIGTSTNLVVLGIVKQLVPDFDMGLFDIGMVGLPYILAGFLYLIVFCRLLPSRVHDGAATTFDREYIMALRVLPNSTVAGVPVGLAGKSIKKAGLRRRGAFLFHIQRGEQAIPAPDPDMVIEEGDLLLFAGIVDQMAVLSSIPGLHLDEEGEYTTLKRLKGEKIMVEAVVGSGGKLVGNTIRDSAIRTDYGAAVIAVHRHGERINSKLGDIVLQPGDSLLLVADRKFVGRHRHDTSFALLHQQSQYQAVKRWQAALSILFCLAMIVVGAVGVDFLTCAFFCAGLMLLFRFVSPITARESIRMDIVLVIGGAFGIAAGMQNSGAAHLIAQGLATASRPTGVVGLSIAMYFCTSMFAEFVTNNAAAAVVTPVGIQAAMNMGITDITPIVMAIMLGGSASFMTPTGYQCNLLVYGPGGYKYWDYTRFGGPMWLFLMVVVGFVFALLDYWWAIVVVLAVVDVIVVILLVLWDYFHQKESDQHVLPGQKSTEFALSEIGSPHEGPDDMTIKSDPATAASTPPDPTPLDPTPLDIEPATPTVMVAVTAQNDD